MPRIALAPDVTALIGPFADKVENRSLLLDKFIFHKSWPVEEDERGRTVKWDDASRWSFMRLADNGGAVLRAEVIKLRRDAEGRNIEPDNRERKLAQAKIAEQLSQISAPGKDIAELRARHTRRFLTLFQNGQSDRGAFLIGKLEGRLAINLADGLIQNANICLDRLLGLPYIPGAAVKGACRHAALEELRQAKGEDRARLFRLVLKIFGATEADFTPPRKAGGGKKEKPAGDLHAYLDLTQPVDLKGAISFLPAWPTDTPQIVVDLTNVHTPAYYGGDKREKIAPGDLAGLAKEAPRPNPFPVVEAGAHFAFSLVLNGMDDDAALLAQAVTWLRTALTVRGLGAKTSAGYGWFSLDDAALQAVKAAAQADADATAKQAAEIAANTARAQAEAERLTAMSPEEREMDALLRLNTEAFALFAKTLAEKTEIQQRAFLRLLIQNKEKRERWKTWKKNKPEIAKIIEEVRSQLGAPALP
ncbi:CRISPR type III-B/RAMP module RAMP protein Cmr6 [Prosthecobacter debontii]|uniref:CRISPR type III-B/RAMP module RAMP protein Cmr6 n=1 Tax=Prosthecobacter debontii TaxID=48467 RepID=A0A1T4YIT9_9BACT|nr:type III-B CRISPR module RAMP protein Cmr6 [Prosthecobacter debontii]SKB01666.1 CRISPR type III-B/RAMP module RAMP protein Cmr6 [Prosthecobacter debontii]